MGRAPIARRQLAVVVQNKDPDNLDRVKVRLPWLDHGDTDQTHWAQLVTPMEGDKFGWYALPDIDDVVVVMFIGGDISQPIILGGVYGMKYLEEGSLGGAFRAMLVRG